MSQQRYLEIISLWRYSRNNEAKHDEQILVVSLNQPRGGEQYNDDIETEHHGQQLRLQLGKIEALDDDIGKGAQPTRWESREDLDGAVTVHLWVTDGLPKLVGTEFPVLQTRLVGAHPLNHQMLVLLAEALGTHWRVRHPPDHEETPENRGTSVCEKQRLPRLKHAVVPDQTEAVGQQTTHDLLRAVHHVPANGSADWKE